ncbi:MAG: Metal cation transporter, ZIP family [Candidatus Amesbacteria bacterium GW2011_GWA2_47_70]|uniref:Metal cation transporter, ZIP family n=1 Tax=Candidatus Amesbacteria bacterium GW2011_GWC2_45_19 TaxID=1618366 RepID=A0A0G1M3K1_9BACT|nr:MAG: Metal cation transporter, ZIP family [Candidatus Amesbacteria bacterium GW2011_GWC2_45_19]KKU37353.1 MAG: Metal cation transporter, ZIP family [Candidatus Amesbacteria bacterium GW2011_GWA1_46_35]KKU68282.1 MAG: Metal cation transporter, ZIP family [Microgenomates group bacterium GW2011_GWC1_47_20]KKU79449.1 MAG: Metal cation transporter, ZIP family [Candidatus Amesbacteria bacterium GW2011_GWA2_47_70]
MGQISQILIWTTVGSVASLGGGILLALRKKAFTHEQSLLLISFAAGVLLSTAFFDLLPEAIGQIGQLGQIGQIWGWVLAGIIFLFLLEKFLWYHHHDEEHEGRQRTPILITVGDTVHNFIDGVVIAGTFMVAPATGIVTALAVAAHEIPHEMADFGVLLSKGWARKKVILVNLASAGASLVGAVLMYSFGGRIEGMLPVLLSFSGGMFIYLACSDLIPELHHGHTEKKRETVAQMAVFGVGIIIVLVLKGWLQHI